MSHFPHRKDVVKSNGRFVHLRATGWAQLPGDGSPDERSPPNQPKSGEEERRREEKRGAPSAGAITSQ